MVAKILFYKDNEAALLRIFRKWQSLSDEKKTQMSKNAAACYHSHFAVEQAADRWVKTIYPD